MSNLPVNRQQGILILLIFVLGNDSVQMPLRSIVNNFDSRGFSRDLHRLVDMLDRMETFSQLSAPSENALVPAGIDMDQLATMAGSFMNLLGSSEK